MQHSATGVFSVVPVKARILKMLNQRGFVSRAPRLRGSDYCFCVNRERPRRYLASAAFLSGAALAGSFFAGAGLGAGLDGGTSGSRSSSTSLIAPPMKL